MFQISDISKSFGGRTLFEGVTLQINPGDRWGLVGPRVEVRQPGGSAVVEITGDADGDTAGLALIGPSQFIATIEIPRSLVDAIIARRKDH